MPRISRRGFTMIEMLIVVMTVGLLAAVALPSLSRAVASQGVHAAASVMAADIEAGFSLAARSRRPMVFTCSATLRRCRVTDQATGAVRFERLYTRTSGFEVRALEWTPTNTSLPVVIGPSGLASQGFTVTLTTGSSAKRVVALRSGLVRIN